MAWGDEQRTDGCFTYVCSENGRKGFDVIEAESAKAAVAEYRRRNNGRNPDSIIRK